MAQMQMENNEIDKIINNALSSDDSLMIPHGLSEKVIIQLEKKIILKELILELSLKIGLVLGSLCLLAGVFVWIYGNAVITNLYAFFITNRQIIISILLLVFITTLFDQIGLRFYTAIKDKRKLIGLN
jgi:hypothetical protein